MSQWRLLQESNPKRRKRSSNIKIEETMKEGSFTNVPPEITIDILSRLPTRTILSCKSVCKSWLHLIESLEFANFHLSKSVPSLVCHERRENGRYKVFELVDDQDLPHFDIKFNFDPKPGLTTIHSSVDGLVFLHSVGKKPFYICNPITREYIELPPPSEKPSCSSIFGLGASKITGQYKLVMVDLPKCEVYTLGTGSWRKIAADSSIYSYHLNQKGVFLNGNLHWMIFASEQFSSFRISCFDVETEHFSTFSCPTDGHLCNTLRLSVLEDHLCLFYNSVDGAIRIWFMKEYGDEKSWTRKFFINEQVSFFSAEVYEAFKDSIRIFRKHDLELLHFSSKNTIRKIEVPRIKHITQIVSYTPSFLPLLKT